MNEHSIQNKQSKKYDILTCISGMFETQAAHLRPIVAKTSKVHHVLSLMSLKYQE